MIKNESYITIQGWMIKDLHLSGNELMVYAIVYGFTQDGNTEYKGGTAYLAEWCGCDRKTVYRAEKSLEEKGLIERIQKEVNGVKLIDLKCKMSILWTKCPYPMDKMSQGGMDKMSHHNTNIDNNNDNNTKNKIKVLVKQGEFYIEDSKKYCPYWYDIAGKLTEESKEKLCEWFLKKYEYEDVEVGYVRAVIEKWIEKQKSLDIT